MWGLVGEPSLGKYALAKAFDFTPTQLEEYAYRLWEIEGYFEEEEEDTYFY